MRNTTLLLTFLLLVFGAFAQDTIKVDTTTKFQTIKGWGATGGQNTQFENTPTYLIRQIINESVDDLGLTGLRYECYQGSYAQSYGMCRSWEWTNDNGSPDTSVWKDFDTTSIDYYMKNLFLPWKQRVVADGLPFTFYVDPSWYTFGSTGNIPAFLEYSPGEYSEYIITNLEYLKNKYGLVADYVTMCNEAGNANFFTPGLVDTMLNTVGKRIAAAGLSTTIQFPECVNAQTSWNYINALISDTAAWHYIKCLSYHLYGTNDPYRAKIDSVAKLKGLLTAQTEYIGLGIDLLYQDMTLGGVSYWDFYGNGDYMPQNANNTWFTYGAKFWTTHQVIHYNPPGSIRVNTINNDTAQLKPLVFVKGGKVTVTIINDKTTSVTTTVTVTGLPPGNYGVTQTLTSGTFSVIGLYTVPLSGIVTVPVAQNGVVTIYPHPATLPPIAASWAANPTYIETPATSVSLSSSAFDPQLLTVKYHWVVDSFPVGATVSFTNPNISNPTANGMTLPGDYVFGVTMSNGTDSVKKEVTVMAFTGNLAPQIVELQSRIPTIITLPTDTTVLHGFAQDMEGDALTYKYSVVSEPIGAAAVFTTPTSNNTTVEKMTVAGDYVFQFSVSDGKHPAVTRNILTTVYELNHVPVISAISATPSSITLPNDTSLLSATTSDPDTDIISHWWTVNSAPVGAYPVFDQQGERTTGVHNLNVAGVYVFTLTVVDRTLYTRKNVTVTIAPLGISELDKRSGVLTYPNPVSQQLNIELLNNQDNIKQIFVVNALGERVMEHGNYGKNTLKTSISTETLPPGVYFLEIYTDTAVLHSKFVKE